MKTIILMRHGKAKKTPQSQDLVRPLSRQGIKTSSYVALSLKKENIGFDAVLSSPAIRALETAYLLASPAGFSRERITVIESFYQGMNTQVLFQQLSELDDKKNSVLVVGHNPALSRIARELLPGFRMEIPASGVLVLSFNAQRWTDLKPAEADFTMYKIANDGAEAEPVMKVIRKDLEQKAVESLSAVLKTVDETALKKLSAEVRKSAKLIGQKYAKQADICTVRDFSRIKTEPKPEKSKRKEKKPAVPGGFVDAS